MRSSYIIGAIFSCLVFLVAACGFRSYRKPIGSLLAEKFPFLRKIPWDTVLKGLAIAGIILFLKKVLYYMGPFFGIIQTPSSIWWVDLKVLKYLFLVFFSVFFIILLVLKNLRRSKTKRTNKFDELDVIELFSVLGIWFIWGFFILSGINLARIDFFHLFIFIFRSPLFFLKIVCSGKYLGLLTGFLVGYYCVDGYKKLKSKVIKKNVKFFFMTVLILVFAWVVSYFYFTGNWESRFQDKILSAQSKAAVEELPDAVHSITDSPTKEDSPTKITALGQILRAIHLPWTREALRKVLKETLTIKSDKEKAKILRDLALVIARTGDRKWAEEVAQGIPDKKIKSSALKQLSEVQGKKP